MPITSVKSPDGRVIRVSHPEGATRDQIIAYAKNQAAQPESKSAPVMQAHGDQTLKERRDALGGGTLQFGPFDTGIATPQWLDEGLAGMGRRMTEIGTLGFHNPDPMVDRMLDDSVPATVGGILTDVGAMAFGGAGLKAAGGVAGTVGTALAAPQKLASGMAAAGAYGAATDPDRVSGGVGAALGQGVGYGMTKLAGKVASPYIKSAARDALDKGASLTPGEMLGGTAQRMEDAATSIPIVGDAIRNAKRRSLESYGTGIIDDALGVIGKSLPKGVKPGRDSISAAHDVLSSTYDDILKDMNVVVDRQFAGELSSLRGLVDELPATQQKQFDRILGETILDPFNNPNQKLLGQTFKESDSRLRMFYKKYQKSGDLATEKLGDALRTAHRALIDLGKRQNPSAAEKLAMADKAYAMMGRVDEAANYIGAGDGIFTPSHMLNAVKKNTSKRQFAAGKGFNQGETEAAKDMLAQSVPDSGTPARMLFNLGVLGTGTAIHPAVAASLLGSAGLYTKAGQKVITPLLAGGQAWRVPLRKGIEATAPYAGLLGAAGGMQVIE